MNDLFVLDKDSHIPIFSSVCVYCRHLDASGERKCAAFPGGIPLPIWLGENDHRTSYPGDHGVKFAPVLDAAAVQRQPPLSSGFNKKTKGRKRLPHNRMHSARVALVLSRLWQDPNTREKISEIIKTSYGFTEKRSLQSIESLWLDKQTILKGKPQKKKTSVGNQISKK